MKKCLWTFACLAAAFGIASSGYADKRAYVWTYEYMTMPKGMAEVEYYLTLEVPDTAESEVNIWKHWVEFEYGITDRWDVSMYQMWRQENAASDSVFGYDGFKIRTRYRFGERGKYFLDPELYFEYIGDDDLSKPGVGEMKLILAKDIGNFNISYNQIFKVVLEDEGDTEHEYAVGINYGFLPSFRFGIESKGNYTEDEYAVGPTISWADSKFWASLGAVFGLNERTDDVQARLIVGIPF